MASFGRLSLRYFFRVVMSGAVKERQGTQSFGMSVLSVTIIYWHCSCRSPEWTPWNSTGHGSSKDWCKELQANRGGGPVNHVLLVLCFVHFWTCLWSYKLHRYSFHDSWLSFGFKWSRLSKTMCCHFRFQPNHSGLGFVLGRTQAPLVAGLTPKGVASIELVPL